MLETSSQPDRLAWLAGVVPSLEGSGVIYVLTIADTTRVASFLRTQGIDAHAYSGETEPERRLELEDALIANEVKALVATSALGVGFDKPDLGFVIHYQSPSSAIAYYQQVGRGPSAIERADPGCHFWLGWERLEVFGDASDGRFRCRKTTRSTFDTWSMTSTRRSRSTRSGSTSSS
jgi:superfamily II DNA helicase RecQ